MNKSEIKSIIKEMFDDYELEVRIELESLYDNIIEADVNIYIDDELIAFNRSSVVIKKDEMYCTMNKYLFNQAQDVYNPKLEVLRKADLFNVIDAIRYGYVIE